MKIIKGSVTAPTGFLACGIHAGLKRMKKDMSLIVSAVPAVSAGTFTTNKVKAAPVVYDMQLNSNELPKSAIVINSGNANACTGEQGLNDCKKMAELTSEALAKQGYKIDKDECFVASTGVIGRLMDMGKIEAGINQLSESLSSAIEAGSDAAEAICTTDTYRKEIAVSLKIDGKEVIIGGIAKGSGMIHPNMATTLSFVTSDVSISQKALQKLLGETIEDTFNMVSVDGDTSTNDTCLIMCNGLAGNEILTEESTDWEKFADALSLVLGHLAKELVRDGEGATKFLEVEVKGAQSKKDAKVLARSIISSTLFKAALFGSDANWGRALCAMGYSGANFNPDIVDLSFESEKGSIMTIIKGVPQNFDEDKAKIILLEKDIKVVVNCNEKDGKATAWGCDLSYDYVKINGDYRS